MRVALTVFALECIPLLALPLWLALETLPDVFFAFAILLSVATGLGWVFAGMAGRGCAFAAWRAGALVLVAPYLLFYAVFGGGGRAAWVSLGILVVFFAGSALLSGYVAARLVLRSAN